MTYFSDLLHGYHRFRDEGWARERARWADLRQSQSPRVMVIACSDSRVDPAQVFDTSPGEIFVVRNVANLVPRFESDGGRHGVSAALEFAVHSIGVKHIVVMGHGGCGGIEAVVGGVDPLSKSDFIGKWMADVVSVADAVPRPEGCSTHAHVTLVERASIAHSLDNLHSFPWIARLEATGELSLHGAWFDVALGELHMYDAAMRGWEKVAGE